MENTQSARAGLLTNGVNKKVEMLHYRASVQLFPNLCSNSLRELQRRDSTRFVVVFVVLHRVLTFPCRTETVTT